MKKERLRNEIASIPLMSDGSATDDNLAIALVTYFASLPDRPIGDINYETGWSQWAVDRTYDVIDRIVEKISTL